MRIKLFLILASIFLISFALASQIGMNYYTTSNNYLEFPDGATNQTYKYKFMMDDIGTIMNTPAIADIDNDGVNELIVPEYSGLIRIYNWTGIKTGVEEARDGTDRGTYHLGSADGNYIIGGDNDGDGYLEMALSDYNGYLRVLEYDGTTVSLVYQDGDVGTYRSSPTWCDIDEDGDKDIFICTYEGVCRLYLYDSGTFTLNFTDSDRGTYHYGTHPKCGNWSNSDWGTGLIHPSYDGVIYFYNWTGSSLEMAFQSSDHGSIYASPYVGEFVSGSDSNYIVQPYTHGITYVYNCSKTGCNLVDSSSDIGSFIHGGSEYVVREISNQIYLFNMNSGAQPIITYMNGGSEVISEYISSVLGAQSYNSVGMPRINSTNNYEYLLYTNRYGASVGVAKKGSGLSWDLSWFEDDSIKDHFFKDYYSNGFLYSDGWACGNLSGSYPDECIIFTYDGIPLIYTLQNVTEFQTEIYDDYELGLIDIMPKNALQYIVGNRTYCVNENENVLLHGLGGGNIDKWIDAMDDEGSAITNEQRITDGVLSTKNPFHNQNSVDYITFDSGNDQSMRLNLTKLPQLGEVHLWTYFHDARDPQDLKIEISNTTCTHPDTNVYTTIFDELDGASDTDISGAMTYAGLKAKFLPQKVGCIRVTSSGAYYSHAYYTSGNHLTEIAGYYANDCTFYHVPMDVRNAIVTGNYNHSTAIQYLPTDESPNQLDNNLLAPYSNFISGIVEIINRWIIKR